CSVHINANAAAISKEVNVSAVCQGCERDCGRIAARPIDRHTCKWPTVARERSIACANVKGDYVCPELRQASQKADCNNHCEGFGRFHSTSLVADGFSIANAIFRYCDVSY